MAKLFYKLILGWVFMIQTPAFSEKNRDEKIFVNATIFDGKKILDENAFTVKNERFEKFFNYESSNSSQNKNNIIDLKGSFVMPGFIESHAHFMGLGRSKTVLNLRGKSITQIKDMIQAQAKQQEKNTWITGRGWDQNIWLEKKFPTKKDLDLNEVSNPIYLRRVDGHAAWVNQRALDLAKIGPNTNAPAGGQIIRDENNEPSGVLVDNAIELVSRHFETASDKDRELFFTLAQNESLSHGITSFHDAGISRKNLEFLKNKAKSNQLSVRVYAMLNGSDDTLVQEHLKSGPINIKDRLVVRSIKYFLDGALGSRGALLIDDYHDKHNHKGLLLMEPKDLSEKTERALNAGFQVATHAIGDAANKIVLDVYESAQKKTKRRDLRLRIEHAQLIAPSDQSRFNELGVVAAMQPIHCTSDMTWVKDRIGDRENNSAYPWQSLLQKNTSLAFGSDAPVEPINPILGLYAAVSRQDSEGNPQKGYLPEQKLKMRDALDGFLKGGAYAEFQENQKGAIAQNYLADFIVFEKNIFKLPKTQFLQAKPKMTFVSGDLVFKRDD